jgi:hypothetical protein
MRRFDVANTAFTAMGTSNAAALLTTLMTPRGYLKASGHSVSSLTYQGLVDKSSICSADTLKGRERSGGVALITTNYEKEFSF